MPNLPFSFQHLSIAAGIRAACQRNPDRPAYRHGDKTRTYGALMERVDRVTAAISGDLGLGVGDHGAIVASNSIEYMEIVVGASQAGLALATVNPKLAPAEIAAICEDAGARVLFVDAASAALLADRDLPSVDRIIIRSWTTGLAKPAPTRHGHRSMNGAPLRSRIRRERPASRRACWFRIARGF
jgi:long-chain acyl-CoA synthetase